MISAPSASRKKSYLDFQSALIYILYLSHIQAWEAVIVSWWGGWEWTRKGRRQLCRAVRMFHVLIGWWLLRCVQLSELELTGSEHYSRKCRPPWAHEDTVGEAQQGRGWLPQVTQLADGQAHFWNPELLTWTLGVFHSILQGRTGTDGSQMRRKLLVPATNENPIESEWFVGGRGAVS